MLVIFTTLPDGTIVEHSSANDWRDWFFTNFRDRALSVTVQRFTSYEQLERYRGWING